MHEVYREFSGDLRLLCIPRCDRDTRETAHGDGPRATKTKNWVKNCLSDTHRTKLPEGLGPNGSVKPCGLLVLTLQLVIGKARDANKVRGAMCLAGVRRVSASAMTAGRFTAIMRLFVAASFIASGSGEFAEVSATDDRAWTSVVYDGPHRTALQQF